MIWKSGLSVTGVRAEFLYTMLLYSFRKKTLYVSAKSFFFCFLHSCHLVLGEVGDALRCFNYCLESGAGICLDRKVILEAADGLQKTQVIHFFSATLLVLI